MEYRKSMWHSLKLLNNTWKEEPGLKTKREVEKNGGKIKFKFREIMKGL